MKAQPMTREAIDGLVKALEVAADDLRMAESSLRISGRSMTADLCGRGEQKVREALSTFHSTTELDGWRDIASAPRDGTIVQLYWPHWRKYAVSGFWDSKSPAKNKWVASCALADGPLPTHWQPLPAPPQGDSQ